MFDKKAYNTARHRTVYAHNTKLISRWKRMKGCSVCGYKKHPTALHLDHVDPSTKSKVSKYTYKALNYYWSKERIKQELAKCQVLCANCHAIRTYEERHYVKQEYGPEIG